VIKVVRYGLIILTQRMGYAYLHYLLAEDEGEKGGMMS
jgi:hypothetical protein